MTSLAVVFDLDGTLIASAPDICKAVNRTLDVFGQDAQSLAQVESFIGNGVPKLIERVLGAAQDPAIDHGAFQKTFLHHYETTATDPGCLYPGVTDALEVLRSDGSTLGICTNKPQAATEKILKDIGLCDVFDVVVGGDVLPAHKPDPAPLLHVAHHLGRETVVFVGDSEVDAETAQRADIPFLLYTEGYRKSPIDALPHTFAFDDFRDLNKLIDQTIGQVSAFSG